MKILAMCLGVFAILAIAAGAFLLVAEAREPELNRAQEASVTKAALDAAGSGKVRSIRFESDSTPRSVLEVEVIKPDGTQLDIHVDAKYAVVKVEDETVPPDNDD